MTDRGKVICNLEGIKEYFRKCRENVSLGSDEENKLFDLQDATNEAIAMMKEQEARVLTLDEAFDLQEKTPYPCIFVDIKGRNDVFLAYINDKLYGNHHSDDFKVYRPWCGADRKYHKTEYGRLIRFWKLFPTNKQRNEVKWDDRGDEAEAAGENADYYPDGGGVKLE